MVCGKDKKKGADGKTKPPTTAKGKDSKSRSNSTDKNAKNTASPAKSDTNVVSNNVSLRCD